MPDTMLLTVPEVARELRVARSTAWRLVATGEIPSVKLGGCRRVRRDDLEAWVGAAVDNVGADCG